MSPLADLAVGHADSMSMRCDLNEDVRVHIFILRSAEAPRFASTDKKPFGLALRGWLAIVACNASACSLLSQLAEPQRGER